MFLQLRNILFVCACMIPAGTMAQTPEATELDLLRQELRQLRTEYETRISDLEQRLAAAEQTTTAPAVTYPANTTIEMANNAFNPAIGVIFQGQAWDHSRALDGYLAPGFPAGGEAGPVSQGLSIGETEIDMSANVDDKFTAWLTLPVVFEDGAIEVELEEAWIETLGLPGGLAARFGRFFSNIGYLNNKHAHAWDFIDQPLPYQAFLGGQYLDDGIQLRWLAPTDIYMELGAEVLRGDHYPAAGASHDGVGSWATFLHLGGDVGYSNSWSAGLSYLHTQSDQRGAGDEDTPLFFSGDTGILIADFVWKWSPQGNWKQQNLVIQGEYLKRWEDGLYALDDTTTLPYDTAQDGWYVQLVYQPFPSWRFGARFDTLSAENPGILFAGTPLYPEVDDPVRFSLMADWSNSEFSRLRLQYTHDGSGPVDDDQVGLQYIFSIGAHGAHTF